MKRIHLLIILLVTGSLCLNAQEKRQTKTITGTSYEDQTVGFKDLSNAQLVIREGDKITYSYYLKDGEEILDGDKLVYTVFWKTLLYVKENIKETDYETAADYYEAYYSKQLALFKYFYDNYSKARKIKTPEELLSAAGISL